MAADIESGGVGSSKSSVYDPDAASACRRVAD
jgi:hypothetical protein